MENFLTKQDKTVLLFGLVSLVITAIGYILMGPFILLSWFNFFVLLDGIFAIWLLAKVVIFLIAIFFKQINRDVPLILKSPKVITIIIIAILYLLRFLSVK